jgi:hypothetical protein
MVNDDKPLVRVAGDGGAVAYGTPWDGKHRLSSNVAVPLRAICVLERAGENRIEITATLPLHNAFRGELAPIPVGICGEPVLLP